MKAGTLDRRLTILRRSLSRNSYGEQVETFDELDTVWARKLDITGREFFSAQKTIAEGTARFRIRYRNDILQTDRLAFDSKTYDIKQIAEIGRQEAIEIIATARVP